MCLFSSPKPKVQPTPPIVAPLTIPPPPSPTAQTPRIGRKRQSVKPSVQSKRAFKIPIPQETDSNGNV